MNFIQLGFYNARRAPVRAALTAGAVAISLVAFLLMRSVSAGWTRQVEQTPNNRIVARHRIGWSQTLPLRYVAEIAAMPGVKQAMGARWADLKRPVHDGKYFEITAVHAAVFVAMHAELAAPQEQKQAFVQSRRGMLVSRELAHDYGWKLGDQVVLQGTPSQGEYPFEVSAIYESKRHGFAQRGIWIHWEYYNELLPLAEQDRINIVSAEIHDPTQGANLAKATDMLFDSRDNQTFTQDDQALNASLVGMAGALLAAMDVVSVLILGVVVLIIGNTIAMTVRERTVEYGVLRAIGFQPRRLIGLVCLEACALGLAGGVLSVLLGYPLVEGGLSRFLQDHMDIAPLKVPFQAALAAFFLSGSLAVLAALVPAYQATRLSVTSSLRDIG